MDICPGEWLEEAFNAISEELLRVGIPFEDPAGLDDPRVVAHMVERGDISNDTPLEGRWQRTRAEVRTSDGFLVLGFFDDHAFSIRA
ncbi:MAG: hypothetical protein QW379_01315 [Thermoplasmata archaeon]